MYKQLYEKKYKECLLITTRHAPAAAGLRCVKVNTNPLLSI